LGKLLFVKNNLNKNLTSIKSTSTENTSKNETKNNNLINIKQNNVYGKRKFNELYKRQKCDINLKRKKENKNDEILSLNITDLNLYKNMIKIKKEVSLPCVYLCEIFPDYLTYQIFQFLDIKSLLWKVSLINKELKKYVIVI
jgi:hypothetical protein